MGIPDITAYPMPAADGLPDNTAPWVPDPARTVLLIHDMQRYFVEAFPAGRSPASELTANIVRLRTRCAELGVPVCYTAQPGDMTAGQRGLLQDFWGGGMTAEAEQRAIVPELAPELGDHILTKWRYSAFQRTRLLDILREQGRDQLVICGVYAHVGCLTTANDALAYDIQSFLVADAVADFNADYHAQALRYAAERCSVVLPADAVLAALSKEAVTP
ncbi:isochorismatase family protein [Streptomyces sp. NPDC059398]|uniref:isochorismatase family protein n=1 Tax=Streptomyces sp. NPDC059398 TaxID=3346820 RepID=UPI0036CD9C15